MICVIRLNGKSGEMEKRRGGKSWIMRERKKCDKRGKEYRGKIRR